MRKIIDFIVYSIGVILSIGLISALLDPDSDESSSDKVT